MAVFSSSSSRMARCSRVEVISPSGRNPPSVTRGMIAVSTLTPTADGPVLPVVRRPRLTYTRTSSAISTPTRQAA
ncbi:hypothetical protein [Phytohabitans flavus]|uniref:hypothetical protein n=1 Tax=Phytohabitans flavus TaxID=1076124 RepID=UPI001564506D|nr:hypothetical protein [Phytohabitans flavus]